MKIFALTSVVLASLAAAMPNTALSRRTDTIPVGTQALEAWFNGFIPVIFPNATTNWVPPFEDGTFPEGIKCKFNARDMSNRNEMRAYWQFLSNLITARVESYVIEPVDTVAFATDNDGKNGWVVATAKTHLKTKEGVVHSGGQASAWVEVKWDESLGKRTVTEWREVNTPPNYPGYPWS